MSVDDELEVLARQICEETPLDRGIVRAVDILREAGVVTTESCEGGEGHAFSKPTVKFVGGRGEGWRALAACMDYRLPVGHLQRVWAVTHGEVDGPYWQIVFQRKIDG